MSNDPLSLGLDLVRKAVEDDTAGNYASAVRHYDLAIAALNQARNDPRQAANEVLISLKIREYADRRVRSEKRASLFLVLIFRCRPFWPPVSVACPSRRPRLCRRRQLCHRRPMRCRRARNTFPSTTFCGWRLTWRSTPGKKTPWAICRGRLSSTRNV